MKKTFIIIICLLLAGYLRYLSSQRGGSIPKQVANIVNTGNIQITNEEKTLQESNEWKNYPSPIVQRIGTTGSTMTNSGEYIKGYKYIYTYKDLGITIGINDPWSPIFTIESKSPVFKRIGNKICQTDSPLSNYVEVFDKSPEADIQKIIAEKEITSDCELAENDTNSWNMSTSRYKFFDLVSKKDQSLKIESECSQKNTSEKYMGLVTFVQDKQNPSKYYKIVQVNGCAPSCGSFNILEFF